jgi:hypothetical protein
VPLGQQSFVILIHIVHLQARSIFIESPRNVAFLLSPRRQLAISRESPRPQVSGIGEEKVMIRDRPMPSALAYSTVTRQSETALGPWLGRRYFVAMALAMIVVAVAGFAPSIVDPSRRLAPLTPLLAAHGILMFCWLLLFLFQAMLIRSRHVAFHRRMGIVAVCVVFSDPP